MSGWALTLPFDTDDERFADGVSVGVAWAALKADAAAQDHAVRPECVEMHRRMAAVQGRIVQLDGPDEASGWYEARYSAAGHVEMRAPSSLMDDE